MEKKQRCLGVRKDAASRPGWVRRACLGLRLLWEARASEGRVGLGWAERRLRRVGMQQRAVLHQAGPDIRGLLGGRALVGRGRASSVHAAELQEGLGKSAWESWR